MDKTALKFFQKDFPHVFLRYTQPFFGPPIAPEVMWEKLNDPNKHIDELAFIAVTFDSGIFPNYSQDGTSLFHLVCKNYPDLVPLFLFYGADPNLPDIQGNCPALIVLNCEHEDVDSATKIKYAKMILEYSQFLKKKMVGKLTKPFKK